MSRFGKSGRRAPLETDRGAHRLWYGFPGTRVWRLNADGKIGLGRSFIHDQFPRERLG